MKGVTMVALQRMSIKVSEEMHEWLSIEAARRGLTMNAIIILAVENYHKETTVVGNLPKIMEELERRNKQE